MNTAVRTRLCQFIKTLQCRNFYHGKNESILKIRNSQEFLIIQRGNSTQHNIFRTQPKELKLRNKQKDQIGVSGYFLLGMPALAFCLGVWQVQRRQWKLALIADLHKRVTLPPVELPENLSELESMEYHPVTVRGRFLHDKEFTIGPRSLIINGAGASEGAGGVLTPGKSNIGFYVVTPFQLEDRDLTILVNRGWVPTKYKKNHKQAQTQSNDIVEVTGIVRLNEKRPQFSPKNSTASGSWFYRDLDAMSEMTGAAPVYIELIASETIRGGPIAGQSRVTLRNEHGSYIFTWFSLSIITGWMWHRQFIRKLPLM